MDHPDPRKKRGLNYEVSGDRSASGGDVLFLHGFMGSAEDWDRVAGTLSADFFCIVPDLPGHGASLGLPDETYTIEGAARAVVRLLDRLGVLCATVAGYSMGGRLALYLALRHPERCAGLFLESASPGIEDSEERAARRDADEAKATRLESGDFEAFLRDWYRKPLFASLARREEMVEALIEARRSNDPRELACSLRGMGTGSQPSLWEELTGLRVPALVIAGELDAKFAGIVQEMAESSPRISVEVIPSAGHNVRLEVPEAYLSSVRRSISRADGD
ncbi:MAG: 2-succinyl-6-hydroxy-2,4-cyclohexadiene-1-carboxylate synthase [Rubrobacter sp.]|nr:2-succinyl-6-hydroxy-2,4-cyclohexadiene-1-carboxylate synthase [Rubrobacter sp.]